MKKNKRKSVNFFNIIVLIFLFIALYNAYKFYKQNNFNEFIRSEVNLYTSEFKRDNEIKYSNSDSYKISSNALNDAMFYRTIQVQKNTPYKVTCMVKTKDVKPKEDNSGIGAQISILGTTEKSIAVTGTQDWQKIELLFNSKDREEVKLGFRLGGYIGNCTGTAWFSNFTIESGLINDSNEWKFACFIFENTDVVVDGKQVKLNMTNTDILDITNTLKRFKSTCKELSNNKMTAVCDTYNINTPITKLTYDKEYGYYVAPEDVEEIIKDTINKNDYDHIFVIIRLRK